MKAVIFTHPSDYPAARAASAGLARLGVIPIWSIDRADDIPAESRRLILSTTARNGNLRGTRWFREQLQILETAGQGDEWVLKVDSDTAVFDLSWMGLCMRDTIVIGPSVPHNPLAVYGCCYAVKVAAIPRLRELAAALPDDPRSNEDFLIGKLAGKQAVRLPFQPDGGIWAGYNWKSSRPASDWGKHFQIVCVDRTRNHNDRHATARTLRQLLNV